MTTKRAWKLLTSEYCGCRTLKELVSLNPTHNAVAFCGFILEWWHEKQTETIEFEEDE